MKQEVRIHWHETEKYIAFAYSSLQRKQIIKRQLSSLTRTVRFAAVACKALSAFAKGVEIHGHKIKKKLTASICSAD